MTEAGRSKFQIDLSWNVVGMAVVGISGILLNYFIARWYDTATLGVFNQVLAVYMFLSQLAVMGIHHSTLKHVAEYAEDGKAIGGIVLSGVALASASGVLIAGASLGCAGWVASLLESPAVGTGLWWATPGLLCFGVNKVLLGALNGRRHMRAFAICQALRFVGMLLGLAIGKALGLSAEYVPGVLSIGEGLTLVAALGAVSYDLDWPAFAAVKGWVQRHVAFGLKGFLSGLMLELNTRVDVLMLGWFATDSVVGGYSFASMVIGGFYMLLAVIRSQYNPLLVEMLAQGELDKLSALVKRGKKNTYIAIIAIGAISVGVYAFGIPLILADPILHESWIVYAILVAGIAAAAGYLPFNQILLQGGLPGWHTVMMFGIVAFNVVANAVLIRWFGAPGAAVGTALAIGFSVLVLRRMAHRLLGAQL